MASRLQGRYGGGILGVPKRLSGENPELGVTVAQDSLQVTDRAFPADRLMLWFDFNNHDSKRVMKNMSDFMTKVAFYINPS